MSFRQTKEIKLDDYGWPGCALVLESITFGEVREWQKKFNGSDPNDPVNVDQVFDLFKGKFISGTAMNEKNEVVQVKDSDLADLPLDIVLDAIKVLTGGTPDPKL